MGTRSGRSVVVDRFSVAMRSHKVVTTLALLSPAVIWHAAMPRPRMLRGKQCLTNKQGLDWILSAKIGCRMIMIHDD